MAPKLSGAEKTRLFAQHPCQTSPFCTRGKPNREREIYCVMCGDEADDDGDFDETIECPGRLEKSKRWRSTHGTLAARLTNKSQPIVLTKNLPLDHSHRGYKIYKGDVSRAEVIALNETLELRHLCGDVTISRRHAWMHQFGCCICRASPEAEMLSRVTAAEDAVLRQPRIDAHNRKIAAIEGQPTISHAKYLSDELNQLQGKSGFDPRLFSSWCASDSANLQTYLDVLDRTKGQFSAEKHCQGRGRGRSSKPL